MDAWGTSMVTGLQPEVQRPFGGPIHAIALPERRWAQEIVLIGNIFGSFGRTISYYGEPGSRRMSFVS